MALSAEQETAFTTASGGIDASLLSLICLGGLLATLFVWAAWALVDVYQGWSNEKVRNRAMVHFAVRTVLLLVIAIWMFAS